MLLGWSTASLVITTLLSAWLHFSSRSVHCCSRGTLDLWSTASLIIITPLSAWLHFSSRSVHCCSRGTLDLWSTASLVITTPLSAWLHFSSRSVHCCSRGTLGFVIYSISRYYNTSECMTSLLIKVSALLLQGNSGILFTEMNIWSSW